MKYLYKFYWDAGRMGHLSGLFLSTPEQVEEAIGNEVYFGEVLGKHSEVYGILESGDIELVSMSKGLVDELYRTFESDSISGYNPIGYYEERKAELEEEEEEQRDEL